jgi:alcohol dehydrogenase
MAEVNKRQAFVIEGADILPNDRGTAPGQWLEESGAFAMLLPDPIILDPTDAIVRIDSSTICGTDLHILKGDVPEVKPGTILGHEAVGTVVEVGAAVTTVMPGDRVLVSCISSCGRCRFCKEGHYGLCTGGGGWIFGHLIDGLQAELARVPFADTSVYKVPDALSDEQVLFLADILPTAYEVGVLNGRVEPGDTVAVVGAGPIGLATIMTAKLHTPGKIIAIDLADSRLEKAIEFGADATINNGREDAVAKVMELTDGLGADVAIECVGVPETFELCTELIRPGGRVANVGVHGKCATLHLEKLWIRDVMITTGLVDTSTTPKLLKLIEGGKLDPTTFATHRFSLDETEAAYDVFGAAAETHALKVVLSAVPVENQLVATEAELVGV